MPRSTAAALLVASFLAAPMAAAASADARTAEKSTDSLAIAEDFARSILDRSGAPLDESRRTDARAALDAARRQDPANARWPLALGVLSIAERAPADARSLLERSIALDATIADAHYWHATAIFSTINDAGMLAKGRLAGQGRSALERAIELDPDYIAARIALAEFYRNAPGIAGGSMRKAQQQAESLLTIEGGQPHGHRLLGAIAMSEKQWADAERHYSAAVEASTTDRERSSVLVSLGYGLLLEKKDASAALPHLRRAYELRAGDADTTTLFLYGRALAETGACADAIPLLERAVALNADAKNTRLTLADCYAKQGRRADAVSQYEEFIRRFPSDDLTRQARRSLRDLQK